MGTGKLYRGKFRSVLVTWILLSTIFTSVLSTLVQPTSSPTPWWNNNWNFRKGITLNHTQVVTDLANFPVLIDIVDNDLKAKTQFDGDDIVFVGSDNNTLNHEVEFYDSNSGHLVAWVKIPLLSSTENTPIYMYYGNPSASNQQNSSAVWDSNFVMVQHLEETSTIRYDSAVEGNNGTAYGGLVKSVSGKVDGADDFDGVNDYVGVPNSQGLNIKSKVMVEGWFRSGVGLSEVAGGWYGGMEKYYAYALAWNGWSDGWTFQIYENGIRSYCDTIDAYMPVNEWHFVVGQYDGQYLKVYIDGQLKASKNIGSKTIDSNNNAFKIAKGFTGYWKGTIDEVRISNVARSDAWIQTSYNNEKDPSTFYTIGEEEASFAQPLILNENPSNEATEVYTNPDLSVHVFHPNSSKSMTVIFKEKADSEWKEIGKFSDVKSGTYSVVPKSMCKLGTTYYWSVYITDGTYSTTKTFYFTTTAKILQNKWTATGVPSGISGVLIADVNGDGLEEVIHAGIGAVVCLNGTDGSVIWKVLDDSIGDFVQSQMADLDRDGFPEVVVPLEKPSGETSPAGLLALHARNGTLYWRVMGLGKETYSSPVIGDVDGDGYPEIFIASTDVGHGLEGTGRITCLNYRGQILRQTFAWRPCGGGLSLGDTNGDGEFELYMGDRHMYLDSAHYGDNDYGRGVSSYWAQNLTLRWCHPDIMCSSNIPILADVNGDGVLDVIVGHMEGGVVVLNSTDGSAIRKTLGIPGNAPAHYQPSVYDIDGDGHLELLMADPHEYEKGEVIVPTTSEDIVVWDLVSWQVDARIYVGKSYYGPQVADVTGDGIMEILVSNFKGILIFDKTYRLIDGLTGLSSTLNYAVVQDIDGDAYNEVVISSRGGYIYAFDTPARTPTPRPRTEVQFYSEYRRGAAEYVQPLMDQAPLIFSTLPSNLATEVPLSLSELQFTLTDYQYDLMNYTVTTNPDIGSDHKTKIDNGRYNVSISNLTPSTIYTWYINVTDGTHWTNKTFKFTTEGTHWWNPEWKYRKTIMLTHNKVSSDLYNFPVLIDILDSDLSTKAQPDGGDVVFTDAFSNKLNHEIELYNNNTGHLTAWVNVPLLSSTSDTKLYMYYGNNDSLIQQSLLTVWDSGFVMVQHLEETSTIRYDSAVEGNNGTAYGGLVKSVSGKVDGADDFDGVNDYVGVLDSPSLDITSQVTIEGWFRSNNGLGEAVGGWYGGMEKYYAYALAWNGWSDGWTFQIYENGIRSYCDTIDAYMPAGEWHFVVGRYDGQYLRVFIDGQLKASKYIGSKTIDNNNNAFTVGKSYVRYWKGSVDEVRISNVARSAEWIQTSYNNQKDPGAFYIIGNEETYLDAPIVFMSSPSDKATGISIFVSELSFNLTDGQGDLMNYTVTTYPVIGSSNGISVANGRYIVPVSGLQYFTTYTWTVSATDGTHWTNVTFSFATLPTEPPTQDNPILLVSEEGNIICYNQTTYDPEGAKVTNIYNWYRNNTSTTNLMMPFDTNSSTTAKDYSGYDNGGTIVRGVTWTSNGIVGGAYRFERGFIEISGTNALDGGGHWSEITVEHWIYLSESQSGTRTIARIPSYEIGITGNKIFAGIWIATGDPIISGYNRITYETPLQTNRWYHVALTYKSNVGLTLYIDGTAVATKLVSGNIQPSGSERALYIGWFDYFKGMIDEVRIYPKSLSPQQIYQRYLETKDGLSNSSTIVSQEINVGDLWKCEVTPNDSHQDGTTKSSNTIIIGYNNKPSAKDLTITPTTPKTTDDLVGNYTFFDPDGNLENITLTEIRWYRNDDLVPELNNTLTVPSNFTLKGDIWYFTVKPSDGKEYGTLQTSAPVLIQNSPPTIDSYFPLTDPTISEEDSQEFNITYSDLDGDNVTVQWYLNGTPTVSTDSYTFEANYTSAGTYNVTVVILDGVGQASHEWVLIVNNINRPPVAVFTESAETVYIGASITFNASNSYDPDDTIASYFWDFGDGTNATGVIVSHPYAINGTFTVTLTVTDSDGASNSTSATKTVLWNAIPIASFTESAETVYTCEAITFNASASYDPDGTITSYFWTFGDETNATGVVVTHAYTDDGAYTVTLTVTDNVNATGSTSATKTVLNRQPVASFTESAETVLTGEIIYFNASSSYDPDGSIVSYFWDFGDGTNATGIIAEHTYADNGTYTVTLTVTDNDDATASVTATKTVLNRAPVASFTESASIVLTGEVITFNASESYDLDGYIVTCFWDFGDGSNATGVIVEHAYADNGTYVVTLTVTDDDGATASSDSNKTVQNQPPTALFTESAEVVFTAETISFNASSSYDSDGTIVSFFWNFGDGTNATGMIVDHAYAENGTYTVTLTVTDDDNATDTETVVKTILNRPPIAIFTESAETVYTSETITFNASSSYDPDGLIISYFWDFGDETNATEVIVEHAYADDGNYTVTLTVTDDDGTNATTIATKNVLNRPPVASFTYSPASPIAGETVTFNASSSYDPDGFLVSYRWDFGDGNITTVTDPIINHAYSTEGNYTAILNVTDNQALSDPHSITLEVRTAGATYQTLSHTRALFARPILVTFISLLSIVALLHTEVRRVHYSRLLSKARTPRRRI